MGTCVEREKPPKEPPPKACAWCDKLRPPERWAQHGSLVKAFCCEEHWRRYLGSTLGKGDGGADIRQGRLSDAKEGVGGAREFDARADVAQ